MSEPTNDAFESLANAVVLQAVEDYRRNAKQKRSLDIRLAILMEEIESVRRKKSEIERFFKSKWYQTLTDVNGELLLKKLEKES